jgi:hypothetical protein
MKKLTLFLLFGGFVCLLMQSKPAGSSSTALPRVRSNPVLIIPKQIQGPPAASLGPEGWPPYWFAG